MNRTASSIGTTPRNLFRAVAAVAAFGMVAGGLSVVPAESASAAGQPCFDGSYVVPAGVFDLDLVANGGKGQDGRDYSFAGPSGGAGGHGSTIAVRNIEVTPGETIYWGSLSGGANFLYNSPPTNGVGGKGVWVATIACITDNTGDPDEVIVVAAGGGGGGDADLDGRGGDGGNADARGGSGGRDGSGGENGASAGDGGGAGTLAAPGTGGVSGHKPTAAGDLQDGPGLDGTWMDGPFDLQHPRVGGDGQALGVDGAHGGGGGGGGYTGGGGGGSGGQNWFSDQGGGGGGGGGGASYPLSFADINYSGTFGVTFTPHYTPGVTLTSSANPQTVGSSVTFTATVTSQNPGAKLGGGNVWFSDSTSGNQAGPVQLGVVPLTLDSTGLTGTASITVPDLATGPRRIGASYSGFTGYAPDDPGHMHPIESYPSFTRLTQTMLKTQALTFTAPLGAGTVDGPTVRPTASSTSGLQVWVHAAVEGEGVGVCSLSEDGVLTYLTAGTCVLYADQDGDDVYAAAPQVELRIPVAAATGQTITFTTTPPAVMNGGDTYTPLAVGGGSRNPVVITTLGNACSLVDGVVIAQLGGNCHVQADQAAGNGYSAAAYVRQVIAVNPVPGHMLFLTTPPDSPQIGAKYTVVGQALIPSWGADNAVLTVDAASTACTMSTPFGTMLSNKVVQQAVVTYTAVGTCIIDANVVPSTARPASVVQPIAQLQQISTVAGDSQVISFTSADPPDPTYGGSTTITANGGGSGNPVTFATTTPETCTITGGSVGFIGVGDCEIAADQLGDSTTWGAAPTAIKTLSIAPAPLTVTAPSTSARHGAALSAFAPEYDGFVNGDDSSSLQTLATCARSSTSQDVGSYTVTCAGAIGTNYSISYIGGTATITSAPLTITASSATTGYGLAVPQVTASYDGLVNGATATATVPVCGTTATDQSPVGTYPTTCVDAADPNYTVTVVEGTISITHATLVITPAPVTRTYGDAAAGITPTYLGLENDDTAPEMPPTCTAPVDATTDVGDYVSTCSGADDPNYTISYSGGTVHVTPAALTVVAPNPTTPYGTPVAADLLDPQYLGLAGGDTAPATPATCLTTATPSSPVGTYPVDCSGAIDPNYTISYQSGAMSVTTVPLTITAPTNSALYGTVPTTFAPAYDGFVTGDDPTSLAVQPLCVRSSTSPDVGSYPVTCSGAADSDYTFVYVDGTQTITQVPLAITASSGTTGYGLPVPVVTASYSGFTNGDTATSTAPTCVTTATDQSPVGDYATSCSGAADPNYTITTVDGILNITHATLVITPATATRSYGDAAAAITPTYLGFENDDTAPATTATCTAPVDATTDVGDYVSTCSGADDPNYTIAYSDGVVHVTPAALTVVAPNPTTPYGTPVAADLLDPQYVGLAGGDAAPATPATCLTTATPSSLVGKYPTTCSGATDGNYAISYIGGTLTIVAPPATVIGADPDTTVAAVPPTSPSTAHDSPPGAASPPASDSDADSQTSADGAHAASEAAGVLALWLVLIAVLLAGIILAFVLIARRSDRAQ